MTEVNPQIADLYQKFISNGMSFSTDSRKLKSGDIFFALKGDNFNGNQFASKALELGASIVVVDEEVDGDPSKLMRCDNVLSTFQALAQHHRRQFDIPVIAIAGSNGKTTTKELLTACLSAKYAVHATKGNFNNHIGVPITLLEMSETAEIAVIEIGTNSFGEIAFLCDLLEPNFGLITNIGKEHLEGFGNIEGVAKEESELYQHLHKHNGFAFVNLDDVYLNRMSHRLLEKRGYSLTVEADDFFKATSLIPGIELKSGETTFRSRLQGQHNAENMAAAISVSRHFDVVDEKIGEALLGYRSSNNRSEWREIGSNSFLLDAYNANPSSMVAALNTFALASHNRKVMLLGDMFELGDLAYEEHEKVAKMAWSIPNAEVYLVGDSFMEVCKKHGKEGFKDVRSLTTFLVDIGYADTWFLIKGSRSMRMEDALSAFES